MNVIELNTARLRLRQWRDADLEPFALLNADPRVMEYFPSPLNRDESDALAQRLRNLIDERGWGVWAVESNEHSFIGMVGLHVPSQTLPFSPCVEIAWRLAFDHWHQGYASEAATATLQIAFETLTMNEIVSFTSIHNRRSQKVMQRIGMIADRNTFRHPEVPDYSPLKEHVLYRISREHWHNPS